MKQILHHGVIFYCVICFSILFGYHYTKASEFDQILESIAEEIVVDLNDDPQSPDVVVTFEGDKWVATLTCQFSIQDSAEVSWHIQSTGKRIDPENPVNNMIVTNSISDGIIQSILTINSFTYDNVDQYTCLLAEPTGYSNQTLSVYPKPIVNDNDAIVTESGEEVTLSCTSFPGAPLFFRLPNLEDEYENYNLVNVSNDGDVNQTIAFSFLANPKDSSEYYQCCLTLPNQISQCQVFPVYVQSEPMVYQDLVCSTLTGNCTLQCLFRAYPFINESDVPEWTVGGDIYEDFKVKWLGYQVLTWIRIPFATVNVTCSAFNEYGSNSTGWDLGQSFNIGYYSPYLTRTPVVHLIENQNSFSAEFICSFGGNPQPDIYWFRIARNGLETRFIEQITDETERATIKIFYFPTNKQTSTILQISNYTNYDREVYFCAAVNEYGVFISKNLQAYKVLSDFQLHSNDSDVWESGTIEADCSAMGFPPPKIEWRIVAEFDIGLQIEYQTSYELGKSTSTATMTDQGGNNFIYIECSAYNEFQPVVKRHDYSIINIHHSSAVSFSTPCTMDDFNNQASCTMSCDFQSSNASALTYSGWSYYVDNPVNNNSFLLIDEGTGIHPVTPFRTRLTLDMSDYNAGYYRCWSIYQYNNDGTVSNHKAFQDFHISESAGLNIGDSCTDSHQCISLYATCTSDTRLCQCIEPHSVPFDRKPNTLECLLPKLPDEPCITDDQCAAGETNYICRKKSTVDDYVCTCNGFIHQIDDQSLCLQQVPYGDLCIYTDECQMADPNMECINSKCTCTTDYEYDTYLKDCVYSTTGNLSTSAIVVIVIACFLASALLFAIIGGFIRKRRNRPNRHLSPIPSGLHLAASSTTMPESESTREFPYSEFSNPNFKDDEV